MNLYNLLKKVGFLVLLLTFVSSMTLAQTTFFVNNATGNDANSGLAGSPKATVSSALQAAPAGSIISVAFTGINYAEPTPGMNLVPGPLAPGVTGTYTFTSTGGTPVFTSLFQVGTAATAGTLTFTGPFQFNGLTLTNGTLAGGNNVTIATGAVVTRTELGSVTSGQIAFAGTASFNYINSATGAGVTITTGLEFPVATTVATTLTTTATAGNITLKLDQDRTINGALTLGAGANNGGANLNGKTLTIIGASANTTDGNITGGTLAFTLTGAATLNGVAASSVNDVTATSTGANTLTLNALLTTVNSITASGTAGITANNTGNIGNVTLNGSGTILTKNGTGTVGAVLGAAGNTGTITLDITLAGAHTSASITQSGTGTIGFAPTPTSINVTGNVVVNTAFVLGTVVTNGAGTITFTDVVVTVGGGVTNSASFTGTTTVANAASGLITFGSTATTVTITGAVTNSTTGGWSAGVGGALTTSGSIVFSATTGNIAAGNISNSSSLKGTAPLGDIIATGGGTATLTASAVSNTTTSATANNIDFSKLTGTNTVASVSSSGATTGGDILFGNGNLAVTGDITNSRGAAGADIIWGTAGAGANTLTAVNITNSGASSITFTRTFTGNVTLTGTLSLTGSGNITFSNATTAVFSIKNLTVNGTGTLDFGDQTVVAGQGAINVTGNAQFLNGTVDMGQNAGGARTVTLSGSAISLGGASSSVTFNNATTTTIVFAQPVPNVNQIVTLGTFNQTYSGPITVSNGAVLPAPFVIFQSVAGATGTPGSLTIVGNNLTFNTGAVGNVNTVKLDNARIYIGTNNPGGSAGNFQNTTGYVTTNGGFVMMNGNALQTVNAGAFTAGASFGNFGVANNSGATPAVTFGTAGSKMTGDFYLALGQVSITNLVFGTAAAAAPYPTIFRTEGTFSAQLAAVNLPNFINVTYFGGDKATANEIPNAGVANFLFNLNVSTTNGAAAGKGIITMVAAATVNGTLTIDANQSLYTGANNLTLAGASAVVNGNLVDNGATRVFLSNATGTAFTGTGTIPSLNVNAGSVGNTYSGPGLIRQGFGIDGIWGGAGANADDFATFDGNITFAGGAASSLAVTFSGAGPHVAAITNAAGGTLTLNSNTVASGAIAVGAGTIALGTNNLTAQNAAFSITGGTGQVTGTGTLIFSNAAAVLTIGTAAATIAANVSFTGAAATFNTNNLRFDGNVTLGTATPTVNTFTIPNGLTLTAGGQNVTLNGASAFTSPATGILALVNTAPNTLLTWTVPAAATPTVSNLNVGGNVTLAGPASLTINGTGTGLVMNSGTLTIGGANLIIGKATAAFPATPFTYNGGTISGAGFLVWGSSGVWAQTAALTLTNFQVANALALTTAQPLVVTNTLYLNGAVFTQTFGGVARLTVGNGGTTIVQVAGTGNISNVAGQVVPAFSGTINYLFTGATSAPNAFTWPTAQANNVTVSLVGAASTVTTGASKSIAGNLTETVGQLSVTASTSFTLSKVGAVITVDRNALTPAIKLNGAGATLATLVAADVNLVYTDLLANGGAYPSGPEYSSPTIVRNVSIGPGPAASVTNVNIAASRTVAGTLSMFSTMNYLAGVTTNWTLAQTIPAGSVVNTAATSTTNWNGGLTVLGTYNNTGTTSGNLSGTGAITNVGPTGVMNLTGFTGTGAGTLVLGAGSVINMTGDATFNNVTVPIKAGATLAATVNTPNNLTFTGTLTNSLLNLAFTGANDQTVTLPGNRTINNFTVTKSADKAVTVSGGNLTLAPIGTAAAAGLLTLTRGIVNMVNPALLTLQATVATGIITNLGYLRNPANILNVAHVVGRLGVFIPAGTIGRSEWPVGALNGDYRPAAITFTAGNATIAPTTIIMSHIDSEPTGVKNFPLNGGTQASDPSKTNWIGTKAPYSWLVEATTSLGASQVFDLELQGTKLQKPLKNHNDLRIIRRFDGNVSVNGWVIEGNNATYSNAMSINVPAPGDTMLTVRDRGSLGSAIAQRAFFTIGAPATLPVFNLPTTLAYTVPEKDSLFVPVKTISNSVNTTITKIELMSGPSFVTYANATGKVDSGTVTIKPTGTDASTTPYTAVLKTTDSQGATSTITLSITVTDVNAAPVFTKTMGSGNIKTGDKVDSTYTATDADGDALTFSIAATTGAPVNAATINASTGAFSWQSATADAGKTFTFTIAVTDGKVTVNAPVATITVVANRPPTWAAGGEMATPQTIFVGDTLKQTYKADDLDNDAITYAFIGNHPSDANLNASTGVFTWAPQTASQFPVIIQVSATDGKSTPITTQAIITIKVGVITVAGKVTYDNTSNTPIVGATVKLMNGATVAGTATTSATGAYSITGVTGGTSYTLTATKTTGWPSSAVLASDALLTARYSVGAVTLTANQKLAADVTGDGTVTAGDALQILRRVVGAITSFTIADWQFETKTVVVGGASVTADFKGIAAGDVNESATTLPKKSEVSVLSGKNLKISPNSEFELPVKLNAAQEVGAFTLRFTYPVQMMTFKSVKSNVDVISYAKDGKISIAWAKIPGEKTLKKGETPTMLLVFKATKAFAKSSTAGLTLDNGEIVNVVGKNMADASVNMSQVEVAIPSTFALSQNYPNPFNPSTVIEYQLPVKGNVTLTIYNTLGQVVKTLIDNQVVEAGSYKTRWNATNLASGIYFYSLRVEGTKGFLKTKKMILLK